MGGVRMHVWGPLMSQESTMPYRQFLMACSALVGMSKHIPTNALHAIKNCLYGMVDS